MCGISSAEEKQTLEVVQELIYHDMSTETARDQPLSEAYQLLAENSLQLYFFFQTLSLSLSPRSNLLPPLL